MKVLHVHENHEIRGGSEVYIRDLVEELKKVKIHSDWFTIMAIENSYEIYMNSVKQFKLEQTTLEQHLDAFFKENQYDLVHIHGMSDVRVIRYFIDRYPTVRSMHEPRMICPGYGKFLVTSSTICTDKFGLHCLYKAYTEKCQLSRKPANILAAYQRVKFEINEASLKYKSIITMSDYVKYEAITGGIDEKPIVMIPYFTKFELPFQESSSQEKRVLFVGRLNVTKGVEFLIKAMIPLLKQRDDVYLDIVGDGDLKEKIYTLIVLEKMETKIKMHGWKSSEEISKLMKDSYLLAFPSIYPEAFGIVGIEAFAHSKPVVAFNVGGVSTWLKDGYNGYLVENKNINQFRENVTKLIEDKKLYKEFTYNAYEAYKDYFTADRHLEKLVQIYKESSKK